MKTSYKLVTSSRRVIARIENVSLEIAQEAFERRLERDETLHIEVERNDLSWIKSANPRKKTILEEI